MFPVINSVTDGLSVYPGQTSANFVGGAFSNTQKYLAATGSTIFPGLLVGRIENAANYLNAVSLDQITSPTIANIIGGVSSSTFNETPPYLTAGYGNLAPYAAGTRLNIFNEISGFIYIFAGALLDGTTALGVATTTTGSGNTLIYAGSLVPAGATGIGPVVALVGYAAINGQSNGATYARGSLVPVSLSFYNR